MAAEPVSLIIEPSDSPRLQRQKREVTKLQEFDKLLFLKKEKAELEAKKMRTCFYSSEPKYRKSITYKNKSYQVPKFSCVQPKLGKPYLRVLLVERSKKAEWLGLTPAQQKLPDWIDKIEIDDTEKRLNAGDSALEELLMKYGLMVEMQLKSPVPNDNQSKTD